MRVEEKEPWALHQLTPDGANATTEEADSMKPPAEPMLVELTDTGVELLLEKYVRWDAYNKYGERYFATLPTPFVKALEEYPTSAISVVRAINTAPLVGPSGRVIDGVGLDRVDKLFHRIDPVLRKCLPDGKPTEEEIKEALDFLVDEWLVDVALDRVGKCVAMLLALTLLQRALLPERPAFFVTAGQRGGGKTTLISMISAAVLGRRPAAAAWSDSVEERKKALFSYLRQGVALLVWDNIARGSTVSCPHIEAALTATEISDRVLGVSYFETVPASTVQVFTGNSIAPRGDMASRSFVVSLNVDRPDPENRTFTHADPLAWTRANRAKILRALYTILIGGALSRPKGQVAKTRFKTWWSLIGWPVEYAASLLDINFDCTELLRAGESGEEEASAASRVLAILKKRWDGKTFTTHDVVKELAKVTSMIEEGKERAEEASVGDMAVTAPSTTDEPNGPAGGCAIGTTVQAVPLKWSASAWPALVPTSQMSLADVAEMVWSEPGAKLESGSVTGLQEVPFQCSSLDPLALPTAYAFAGLRSRTAPKPPGTESAVSTDQAVPSQCSSSVCLLFPIFSPPTAHASVALLALTATSALDPGSAGELTSDQAVPFQW